MRHDHRATNRPAHQRRIRKQVGAAPAVHGPRDALGPARASQRREHLRRQVALQEVAAGRSAVDASDIASAQQLTQARSKQTDSAAMSTARPPEGAHTVAEGEGIPVSNEPIIRIEKANKWYGQFQVLTDVDLEVKAGERIVICGPSGSGKSTLIRCINHLEKVEKGRIAVNGIELTGHERKNVDAVRREVGMVFQQFNLFPHLTVLQNCTLSPMHSRGVPREAAEATAMKYLQRVRIPEQANKYPSQLSGCQQQRVWIARALCMNPKIMLFG